MHPDFSRQHSSDAESIHLPRILSKTHISTLYGIHVPRQSCIGPSLKVTPLDPRSILRYLTAEHNGTNTIINATPGLHKFLRCMKSNPCGKNNELLSQLSLIEVITVAGCISPIHGPNPTASPSEFSAHPSMTIASPSSTNDLM